MEAERTEIRRFVFASLLILHMVPQVAAAQRSDTIVKWAGTPVHRGVASLVEEMRIGVLDGSPEYTLVSIADVAVGNEGSILILDTGSADIRPFGRPTLRLYDSRGRFVRNVGREGDGPGEYRQPSSVAVMADGRFLLLDRGTHRLTVYSDKGIYQESWKVADYNVTIGVPGALRVNTGGVITIVFTLRSRRHVDGKPPERGRAIVRMREGGVVIDTLLEPPLPNLRVQVTKSRSVLTLPYSPAAFWGWNPLGYFVTGVNTRYAIDLLVPKQPAGQSVRPLTWRLGDPILSIRATFRAVPISAAERADQKEFKESQLRTLSGRQSGTFPNVPALKPYIRHVAIADDGRLWIWVHSPSVCATRTAESRRRGYRTDRLAGACSRGCV